jgi:hypothetical protein
LNIIDLVKHLTTWLALHREFHYDNHRFYASECLALAKIERAATSIRHRHNWAIAAAQALEQNYAAYCNPLALNASNALRQWVDYSLQHTVRTDYANGKKRDADVSANEFWHAIKRQVHQPPTYEDAMEAKFQDMLKREAEREEILAQMFPTRPRRDVSRAIPDISNSKSTLRAEATPFQPFSVSPSSTSSKFVNARNSLVRQSSSSQDSGYVSSAESEGSCSASQIDSDGVFYLENDVTKSKHSIHIEMHQNQGEEFSENKRVGPNMQQLSSGTMRTRSKDSSIQVKDPLSSPPRTRSMCWCN